jgi:hypothetical protein
VVFVIASGPISGQYIKVLTNLTIRIIHNLFNNGGKEMHGVLVGEPEGKRSLERPRCRWEVNCNKDLKGTGWEDVEWIHEAQDRDQ